LAFLVQNTASFYKIVIVEMAFKKKRHFCRKLEEIADLNIDPELRFQTGAVL
jgi:hypothetical protein